MRCGVGIVILLTLLGCAPRAGYEPRDGDIVFHTSQSSQSLAIQLATKSPYSHMGIVYLRDGEPFVFEAVQPVKLTPLDDWIERGERAHFVVKRLRDADARLTVETLRKMRAAGEQLAGKDYDPYFEWSDDRIYCSELVWWASEGEQRTGVHETVILPKTISHFGGWGGPRLAPETGGAPRGARSIAQ